MGYSSLSLVPFDLKISRCPLGFWFCSLSYSSFFIRNSLFFLQLSTFFLFFKNFLFCIRVQLINSVALVLGVPQSDSVICILVSIFKFFSHFYKNALESKHGGNKLLLLLSHFSHVQLGVTP